ncbi:MAG: hypothetical protein EPO09_21055 [Aquabacterium sp.]|uniref:hypothetical protein n=1 Tax=Aquabacterium sp. TaxID=1872578 RepID=UPI0011F71D6D|nr:hypothetical protein [Aquabacterium sp.]TAK84224.1 MAG: hypothetical protein EPO09_21055 [Aquabacterium sp.]
MSDNIDEQTRLLAATAYGEAGIKDVENEIGAIAWAIANRCRLWNNCTVKEILTKDPHYAYAAANRVERFRLLMDASPEKIATSSGMSLALIYAKKALSNTGTDLANGGLWWDGNDFGTNPDHDKRRKGFRYGSPAHNIFSVPENPIACITYWKVINKKTGQEVNSKERGRYDHVYISTAAYGESIFWKYAPEYIKATGAKEYR